MFSVGIFEQTQPATQIGQIVVEIDGATVSNLEQLHEVLKTPLKFPGYYGNNLDALYDVLADLAWLKEKPVHLIIKNFDYFLDAEQTEKKIQGLLTLIDAAQYWAEAKEDARFFTVSIQHCLAIIDLLEMCEVEYNLIKN